MESSNELHQKNGEGFGQVVRFFAEVRHRTEMMRMFRKETFDLDELVALGERLGFRFDDVALQQAFRYDFQLRMAIQQAAIRTSVEVDR